jgi:hypothetical protein
MTTAFHEELRKADAIKEAIALRRQRYADRVKTPVLKWRKVQYFKAFRSGGINKTQNNVK